MTTLPALPALPPQHGTHVRPFWNPYVAGVGLGLTLLLSFVTLGTGLGASGAIARAAADTAHAVAPEAVEHNGYLGSWFEDGPASEHYLAFMGLGALLGGLGSAWAAGRMRPQVERGPTTSVRRRLTLALAGGLLVGFASRMAGGCTSGQSLTGGALMLEGSWAFTMAVFAGGFGAAYFVRSQWR